MHFAGVLQLRGWSLRTTDRHHRVSDGYFDVHSQFRNRNGQTGLDNYSRYRHHHGTHDGFYWTSRLFVLPSRESSFEQIFILTRVQIFRDCTDVRSQTFPADCCPNKYVTGLRRVRIRRDDSKLERRTIAFTTTTLATATATRTVKGRSPPVSLTVVSFVEASTPLTTTSTTAFAQSTACISTTRTGFGRCPTDPRTAVEALLKVSFALSSSLRKTDRITNSSQKYQESGERVVIDCGATGLYEQA